MDFPLKLTSLAAALRENRHRLLTDWLSTLRIGKEKPGSELTDADLRNHFAELLEDLCNQLEVPLTEESEISALKHAERHGNTRWIQGYKLPELIREIAALRTVVVAAVVAYGHTRFTLREQSLANIIVHRFFDALVVESASFFATLARDAAVLQERERLAQELHDSACQSFLAARFELSLLGRRVDSDAAGKLQEIAAMLDQGLEDVRSISHGLVAVVRNFERGLPAALESIGAQVTPMIPCQVRCAPGLEIPTKIAFHLFRIAQEAVGNACKHARAKSLSIALADKAGALELSICDDGDGFDSTNHAAPGIGFYNMQQRARLIGAELKIESRPGLGTSVICILPKVGSS